MQEEANVTLIGVSLTLQIVLNNCEKYSHYCILCVCKAYVLVCVCISVCARVWRPEVYLGIFLHLSAPYYLQSEAQDLTDLGAYQI